MKKSDVQTHTELAFAADVRARDELIRAECMARGFTGKRGGWTSYPSGTTFSVKSPTNEERSRAEIIEFRVNPPTGSYCAYLAENPEWREHCGNVPRIGKDGRDVTRLIITTWTGDKLAEVTSTHRPYRSNFGDARVPFSARGINGRYYYGTHNGSRMLLRMRPYKGGLSYGQQGN